MSFYSEVSRLMSILDSHEKEYHSIVNTAPVLKEHINSLKLGLRFLNEIFNLTKYKDLKLGIRNRVMYNVFGELESLSNRAPDDSLIFKLDRAYTNLREMLKNVIINPETTENDVIFRGLLPISEFFRPNDLHIITFRELSKYKADLISPLIKEKLFFLEVLLTYLANIYEHYHQRSTKLYIMLQVLFGKTACLLYSCLVEKIDGENELAISHNLSKLLEKNNVNEIYISALRCSKDWKPGNPLGSELCLLDGLIRILEYNSRFSVYLNDSTTKLHDKLKLLHNFLTDLPREVILERFNYLVSTTESIISEAILIIYSPYDEDMNEKVLSDENGSLPQLFDQIEHIQVGVKDVREIKLYKNPKTDELGSLDLFLEHLQKLLDRGREPIAILKNEIQILHGAFDTLRSFLGKFMKQRYEHKVVEDLWTRIIGLSHQAEYIIDIFLVKEVCDSRIMFSIMNVIDQTKLIMSEVKRIYNEEKYHIQDHRVAKRSNYLQSQAIKGTTDKVVVGFADESEKIKGYLLSDSKKREIISIVGMPGLGKTTLANKMYEDPSLVNHFDIQAWCTVSQTYEKDDLLLSILETATGKSRNGINKLSGKDLDEKLYKYLKGRRYFIVLDDIWDIEAWNDLVRSLPNDNMCSRVLITSRLHDVASQVKTGSIVHHLRQFSDEESWELFQMKLFGKEIISEEFLEVGKQISDSCKGLPLAIVVAAGVLAKLEMNIDSWNRVAENLSSHIFSGSESQCKSILELSYNHLPGHLKSCFLYFGVFAEDEEISVRKLKCLWIAEGFVRKTKSIHLDDVAEEYLSDLISRSLVTATKERSYGGVKVCQIHDLLRDFCLEKAEKDGFLTVAHHIDSYWSDISIVYDHRRVKFACPADHLDRAKPYSFSVRSLFYSYEISNIDLSFIPQNFMLLQVMYLSSVFIRSLSSLVHLIHLRYLAIGIQSTHIPSSLSNLWNLQYLLVKLYDPWSENYVDVPDSLWDMVNLRHVGIYDSGYFNLCRNRSENCSSHDLEVLSSARFSSKTDAENLLRRLLKLRKLKCIFLDCWEDSIECCKFPVMDFLSQLMSLKVIFEGSVLNGKKCEFNFPSNLRKLSLSNCSLCWDDISKIGKSLPNLNVLKLNGEYWDGTWTMKWEVNPEDFKNLKYLKLCKLNLHEWIASENSFPNLEQLVVKKCWNLETIPLCFGKMATMLKVTVINCQLSVDDSARIIQEEQEEWQNQEFKLYMYKKERQFWVSQQEHT